MSTENGRRLAGRAVLLRWLKTEVDAQSTLVHNLIGSNLEPGERILAELPDGTAIGSVTIGKPGEYPTVTDDRALLNWVRENKPTEIVESVNPAYVERLKRQAKTHGHAFDERGEIIPGIGLKVGSPSYRPTVDKAAIPMLHQRLSDVVRDGWLALPTSEERAL